MNIKGMLAGLVIAGSAAALTGCTQAVPSTSESTDVASTANDGTTNDAKSDTTNDATNWISWHTRVFGGPVVARPVVGAYWRTGYVRVAPPAARYEVIGRAPSVRHIWTPGYYRWTGVRYGWTAGRWEIRRPGLHFVPAHYDRIGGYYRFIPARWVRG